MDLKDQATIEVEKKIDALLSGLTLEEKIGQMTQVLHFEALTEGEIAAGRVSKKHF
jgi:beta-glucosidase